MVAESTVESVGDLIPSDSLPSVSSHYSPVGPAQETVFTIIAFSFCSLCISAQYSPGFPGRHVGVIGFTEQMQLDTHGALTVPQRGHTHGWRAL
jgi:hypothetical protein